MHFSIRFSRADENKLIVSVSKKVAKKAVTRNLIKRRVRAVFHSMLPNLKIGTYMVIARSGSESIKGVELQNELKSLVVGRQ